MAWPAASDEKRETGERLKDRQIEAVRFPGRTARLTRQKGRPGIWTANVLYLTIFAIWEKVISKVASVILVEFELPEEVAGFTKYVVEKGGRFW